MKAPPIPLSDPHMIALKAGAACALALALDRLTGNPDHISSCFISVLCVWPSILMGLRAGLEQFLGSVLGGSWAFVAMLLELPIQIGIPVTVAGAVLTSFWLRISPAYPVVAFTPILLLSVPRGTPLETIEIRALSVGIGALSGFAANLALSSWNYRRIFGARAQRARAHILKHLPLAVSVGPEAVQPLFGSMDALHRDLGTSIEELELRGSKDGPALRAMQREVRQLRYLLHLGVEVFYSAESAQLPPETRDALARWAEACAAGRPDPCPLPTHLQEPAQRLAQALASLHAEGDSPSP